MTHVVTENCINCRYTDCVCVCPTEAFREGANMLVIAPEGTPSPDGTALDTCIDCAACVPACLIPKAIYAEHDVPAQWADFIDLNARLSKEWPKILPPKKECLGHLEDGKSRLDLLDETPAAR